MFWEQLTSNLKPYTYQMKILANDGIAPIGKQQLEAAGFTVVTETVPQNDLIQTINNENYVALLVRSATTVRKDLIDACPSLKLIGRGGVGMDNIDVAYARENGLHVINTPASSSQSVAELVMAHLFGAVRFVYDANRQMPTSGIAEFKTLKKKYAKGLELRGKTLGIIGFGRIGQATASYALGCGMNVVYTDPFAEKTTINVKVGNQLVAVELASSTKEQVLTKADFISLHVPAQEDYVIGTKEFDVIKKGAGIVNAARGGVIDEKALLLALEKGIISNAALDVFENEPSPEISLLMNPNISLTPHIGAATQEAQDRIGEELAAQVKDILT